MIAGMRITVGAAGLVLALCPTALAGQAPAPFEVHEASILEIQDALGSGRTTSVALVDAYLARIAAYDAGEPGLNALIRLSPAALAEAAALDRERRERGPRGPLHGIPVLMKDNYEVAGLTTSAGSLALATWVPPRDAFVVARLREAGAVVLGMTNMHELASGITTIASLGGQTRNPYDPGRNPGGSSGGTGAAVAASFAALGWGSDTCGSIRIPAAHQNLFGLRPSQGRFSTEGIVPLSHTQDVPGPLARTVDDLAIGLDATLPADRDPARNREPAGAATPFRSALDPNALVGARIGLLTDYFGNDRDEREPARLVRTALDSMEARGARVVEVSIAGLDSLLAGSSVIGWEFKWDLMDFLAERPDAPVRSLGEARELGLHHQALESSFRARDSVSVRDGEGYRAALAKQEALRRALRDVLAREELDALAYPTVRREPAPLGEPQVGSTCALSAHSGFPAITLPAGFTGDGLPIGVELLAGAGADERLVGLAYAYEQAVQPRRPPSTTPPLVAGRAPEPVTFTATAVGADGVGVRARFTFDVTTGTLAFTLRVEGVAPTDVSAVTLDRLDGERKGPVVHRLAGPGETVREGTLELTHADRAALRAGRLSLNLYTRERPAGAARIRLTLPGNGEPR